MGSSSGLVFPVVFVLSSYLLGSVPFGLLLARFFAGLDVRATGSGNIGATNVARSAGKRLGLATLCLDALKGGCPIIVGAHLLAAPLYIVTLGGFFAVLGHMFPVFLRFRGGKGVATGLGVFLALSPICVGIALPIFLVSYRLTRAVSAGSLAGAAAIGLSALFVDGRREVAWLALVMLVLVVVRHAENIRRLIRRAEHPI